MTPVPKLIVFFQLILFGHTFPDVEYVRNTCNRRCESSLIYSGRSSGLFCDKDCSVLQCQDGCNLFPDVLSTTCSQACSDGAQQRFNKTGQTAVQDEIKNCLQGCVFALDEYYETLTGLLSPLPTPTLERKSKNYSSVFLIWPHQRLENVTYIIHKLAPEISPDWQPHNAFEFHPNDHIKVMLLHPYVTYRFKVLAVVTPHSPKVFESDSSVPITTLPHGVPTSAPKILRLSAPSPTVISLSWAPPIYPNGPLLGYRINLNPQGHAELKQTTLEVAPNVTFWTFSQCQSSQLYVFSLSAWNAAGEGPSDVSNITTPNPVSASETPYLVLGADNKVIKSNILDATSVPDTVTTESPGKIIKAEILFESLNGSVEGIGVHVRRQLIVVSDSDGQVSMISLTGDHTMEDHYPSILFPTAISVDWLADTVYIASRTRIYNCPLDRDTCFVAVDNLASTPTDVKVDPVNGYLYFALQRRDGGLYRVDLSLIQRGSNPFPAHIVTADDIFAFMVDFDNVQLYFPKFLSNKSVDTIMSSFLDGSNVKDFRPKVVKRAYKGIKSLIYYDGVFFWTNGEKVWYEEYDPGFSAFRHNTMLFFGDSFSGFNLFHPKAQPTPVPLTAPTDVEVLFTSNRAQIRWEPPARLQYQGRGAWSRWIYDIELQDVQHNGRPGQNIETAETSATNHTVDSLTPDTVYHVRVRAMSEAGVGPWSEYFVGRTLQQETIPVRVLMGLPGMIIEKDLSQLTHTTIVNFFSDPVDLSWHGDLLLWTTVEGKLYVYNRNSGVKDVLNIGHAYSVAYDWLGGKIFWSEPKFGVIRRADRRGIFPELIYQAEARDIAVDSMVGRLYWASTNSIESSCLNGENHMEIFSVPFFSGRRVISLALNFDLSKVMWYVKGYDSQELYMADMIGIGDSGLGVLATVRSAGSFHSISQTSGLQYYSHRLFWVDSVNALVVGDMQCNYTSVVAPFNNVTTFAVAHPSMQDYPAGMSEESVFVIPETIEPEMIRTVGSWDNFNLTWATKTKVNHGTLFYKLYLKIGRQQIHRTTSDTWYSLRGISAYTPMVVSLQPYTYWGSAEAITMSARSPMSIPTAPQLPRVYVTQHKNATTSQHALAADFRWSTPLITNGILSYHIIVYWQTGHQDLKETIQVPGTSRHFILTPLSASGTYYFQVFACTEVGCGDASDVVSATTDAVNPVPMLMIATAEGVSVSEFDSDLNTTLLLPRVSPSALAYLAQDNRTFWIEHSNSLFVSQNSQQRELVEMTGTGLDLTLDWISRTLYVVENLSTQGTSSIMGYHMDQELYQAIITTDKHIGSVISDPYTSMLLWSEIDIHGQGNLMSASLGSKESQIILGNYDGLKSSRRKRSLFAPCSCSDLINVSPTIAMDYKKDGQTQVIFVDLTSNAILAADINGCNCTRVYSPPPGHVNGLPPSLLAVDHLRVYWYNKTESRLYSINKDTGNSLRIQYLPDVQDIIAFGSHLQPLPDSDCLDPGVYSGSVTAVTITNTSVMLDLQPVKRPELCGGISVPQDKFTIYYKKWSDKPGFLDCSGVSDDCLETESYNTRVELTDLEPFTEYIVQVAVSNYYTEYLSEAMSDPTTFTTKRGMPYAARDIQAIPATPEEIYVEWMPPLKLNGPESDVTYVVHFSTITSQGHFMRQTENLVLNESKDGGIYTVLKGLETNHTYDIKVQACMKSISLCNDSEVVQAQTFNLPSNITFLSATHDTLNVMWQSPSDDTIPRHNFEYAVIWEGQQQLEWQQRLIFPGITVTDTAYNETFTDLKPNTPYTFRLLATYKSPLYRVYIWPKDVHMFVFKTGAWVPEAPYAPMIRTLNMDAFEVVWEEPDDNGDPVTTFTLQYSPVVDGGWEIAYTGPEQHWLVDESLTLPGVQYVFRVVASNSKGMGMYSPNSTVFLAPAAVENGLQEVKIGVIVAVCAFVIMFVAIVIPACLCLHKQREEKKKQQLLVVREPDTELANLRQHPQSTFLQSNTLYGLPFVPTDADIAALPHVCRDQLDLTQFLGSGAFGEVYEGVARDILTDGSGPVRCAIKTLRKSASDHEKEEFLKEAVLMRNFQYQHILGLLGVCLDNDPHFIIMELMEGGDLLTFLRSLRATLTTPAKLKLPDLVKICVHVAKGCKYLEDKHFVHRDLAARNCLVSCSDPQNMVVKIGDFGLAREVYTQDYYRKVGEGLLPVRWMSPESLVDGVFTTQSDIWAFGVLMWEVLTLGQQPYPARTNIEVLHFVRAGGKLERPDKCTDEMFNLMQRCWSFIAEERPCFAYLLQQLEMYDEKCKQMSSEEIAIHSPTGAEAPSTRHVPTNYSTTTSDGSTCSNSSIASAIQVQVYVPQSPSRRSHRRGGSERLTPASKKKRLVTLLGGADDKEKLVVDIPGFGRSRTSSLDSKRSSVSESSRTAYTQAQFPAVREYDAMGYLEPRPRRMPQYLQLLNHAPELLLPAFQDGRAEAAGITATGMMSYPPTTSPSAFRPVGPYSRAVFANGGGGKNCGNMRLGSNSSSFSTQPIPSPVPFTSNSANGGHRSSSSSQTYGVVSVQDPTVERLIVDLTDVSRLKASQRKFSDQDLYSSPAQYNQQRNHRLSSASSTASDHPYSRVINDDLNNNCNITNSSSARTTPITVSRDRQSAQDSNMSYSSIRSKVPSVRGNRSASESDSVFEEEEEFRYPPPYVNVQGQHGGRSRGQVYPENGATLAGFDITHASLV